MSAAFDRFAAPSRAYPPAPRHLVHQGCESAAGPAGGRRAGHVANAVTQPKTDAVARATLAARIALLSPDHLDHRQFAELQDDLALLADDPDPLVRAAIAEALKSSTTASKSLILRLAGDAEGPVACPVLQASPLLTDDDLLRLVFDPPGAGTLVAIAARQRISPALATAIIGTDHAEAVMVLLGNPSATLDETALQLVIDAARSRPCWHGALAARPALPRDAALALGAYLAGDHLVALVARLDLPADTRAALLEQMIRRFSAAPPEGEDRAAAFERARVLRAARLLDDALVSQAALREEDRFVVAALQIRSGVDDHVMDRVRGRADPLAIAALASRAGFGAACTKAIVALLCPSERFDARLERRTRQRYIAAPPP